MHYMHQIQVKSSKYAGFYKRFEKGINLGVIEQNISLLQ